MAKLTAKQERFIQEYLIDLNATQAYLRAGYKVSENVAGVNAQRLLRNAKIQAAIQDTLQEIASHKIADATEIMEYLTSVMRREHKENIVVTLSAEKSMYVPDENGTMRKQTVKQEVPQLVEIPAKLSDANKAAELLGKRFGMFTDKMEHSGEVSINVALIDEDDETS